MSDVSAPAVSYRISPQFTQAQLNCNTYGGRSGYKCIGVGEQPGSQFGRAAISVANPWLSRLPFVDPEFTISDVTKEPITTKEIADAFEVVRVASAMQKGLKPSKSDYERTDWLTSFIFGRSEVSITQSGRAKFIRSIYARDTLSFAKGVVNKLCGEKSEEQCKQEYAQGKSGIAQSTPPMRGGAAIDQPSRDMTMSRPAMLIPSPPPDTQHYPTQPR